MLVLKIFSVLVTLGLCIYFFNDAKEQFKNGNNRAGKIARAVGGLNAVAMVLKIIMIAGEFVV